MHDVVGVLPRAEQPRGEPTDCRGVTAEERIERLSVAVPFERAQNEVRVPDSGRRRDTALALGSVRRNHLAVKLRCRATSARTRVSLLTSGEPFRPPRCNTTAMVRRAMVLVVAAFAVPCAPLAARSQQSGLPRTVAVALPDCAAGTMRWEPVLAQLDIELRGMGVHLDCEGGREADARIALSGCDATAQELEVLLERPATGRAQSVRVPLSGADGPARTRVLALAIAELLRTAWSSLDPLPPAAAAAPAPDLDEALGPLRAAARRDAQRIDHLRADLDAARARVAELERAPAAPGVLLDAALAVSLYPSGRVGLAGGRVGVDLPLEPVRLLLDVDADFTEVASGLGGVQAGTVQAGASVLASARVDALLFEFGVTVRAGWAYARGEPDVPSAVEGRSVDGAIGSAAGRLLLRAPLSDGLRASADIEAGYALGGVTARYDGAPILALAGPLVSIALGLALSL